MKREFVWTPEFISDWERCGLEFADVRALENQLLEDPKRAPVIPNAAGARKIRFAFEYSGKSGGARVIYVDFEIAEKIVALRAYAKSDKSDLTQDEKKGIRKMVKFYKDQYVKKG